MIGASPVKTKKVLEPLLPATAIRNYEQVPATAIRNYEQVPSTAIRNYEQVT